MKVLKFLFSGKLMGILLVIFAMSIGYATFIENDYDATTAKLLIYNARWFEWIMLLMIVNFSGMIFTKKLYRKSKINILLMHLSLIIIIIGAGITRYMGFEGQMHIRNGESSNQITTYEDFVNLVAKDDSDSERIYEKIILSPLNKSIFSENIEVGNKEIGISIDNYMPNAMPKLIQVPNGKPMISLVVSGRSGSKNMFLGVNESEKLGDISVSFGVVEQPAIIEFMPTDTGLVFRSIMPIQPASMGGVSEEEVIPPGIYVKAELLKLFKLSSINLVLTEYIEQGVLNYVPVIDQNQSGMGIMQMTISVDGNSKRYTARKGMVEEIDHEGIQLTMNIGPQTYTIPFSIKLNRFELERYPGSMSPSSFASDIEVLDPENQLMMPYRIFMNNILDYRGYRFYQSSYDQDENGTILSVNHDKAGTMVTYAGYFLLFGTLLASLLTRKTRFARLNKQITEIHDQRKKLALSIIFMLIPAFIFGQNIQGIDNKHADEFGKLIVQSKDGRMIPINTIASNSLVKIYKKSSYEGLSPEQVLLGIMTQPDPWKNVSLIKIYDEEVGKLLGIQGQYAAFNDFFDNHGEYKLRDRVDEIYAKSPAKRSQFDKEVMAVDERINVLYMLFRGSLLKIFPVPDHANNKWTSPDEFRASDSSAVVLNYFNYLSSVSQAVNSGNYNQANSYLNGLKEYQALNGKEVMPSNAKVKLEIFYNNANIFKKLFPIFMTLGLILLGIFLLQLFKPSLEFKKVVNVFYVLLFIAFIAQTAGLGLRWYISGHAPWSNGYESMIYIAWATVLAGFIFLKKSPMTLSATSILAGITLLTAHMSWLNPEITNLVPVLKSYWLTFHVATITASYGFLALGSIMGFINLGIMIFRNRENHERVNLTLKELTLTIEMSLMVGLILLVIGNFLGGIWANESWGRYWGWDPKETWSLVTIIVYSFILHMRLIPGLKSMFSTNFMALIGFGSVLMTYFGVNYYLSGLHSYAQGDPVPVPTFVYYLLAAIAIVSILAMINEISLRNKIAMTSDVITDEEDL